MASWIGQEEFNSLGRDGVSALQTTSSAKCCSQVAAPLLPFPDTGEQFWPPTKETKKGKARKERLKHLLNPVLRSNENFSQSPMQVLGHSSQGDRVSSVALHLSLWERQQENTWEMVWILLDNFSSVYCHIKSPLGLSQRPAVMGTHCIVRQLQSLAISDMDLNKGADHKICKKKSKPEFRN